MPRMRILSAADQARLEQPPVFDSAERKRHLDFSRTVLEIAQGMRGPANRIGFLLSYGYFRTARRFFAPEDYHPRDIVHVARVVGLALEDFEAAAYKETTRLRHQRLVLDLQGFQAFDAKEETRLVTEIATMARAHLKPRMIFGRCVDFLIEQRVQVPGVRRLTDLIRHQLADRKRALMDVVAAHLTSPVRAMLDDLFEREDGGNRYRLSLMRKHSQSSRPTKVRESAEDFSAIAELYHSIVPVLEALDLGREGIRYYAGGVLRSEIFQLHRRAEADRHLHAIAFIADQHHRLHDALIDRLLSVVQSFDTAAARDHKDQVFERRQAEATRVGSLLDTLETEVFGALRDIRSLVDDTHLSSVEKLDRIRTVLDQDRESAFQTLRADIRRDAVDRDPYFQALERRSRRLQNRVSPILRVARFGSGECCTDLMGAIAHFCDKDGAVTASATMAFLDQDERDAVLPKGGAFRVSLYKVFLFRNVAGAIKAGNLNLEGSYKYRPLDDYLISRERWKADKAQFLERAGLIDFADPAPVLAKLDETLHRQYQQTNAAICDGANLHLTITAKGGFRVATPAQEEFDSEPLQRTLSQRHYVPLAEILATVNRHCGLLDEFCHWQQAHTRQAPNPATLFAGIMGLGCGIGAQRMARISPSVTERELEHAINWRFSLDNIVAANDRVASAMDRMELPAIYRRSKETLHTSSDGQKFEVRRESLNASYSFKYFGKGQGVSAYTFIDERNILWHSLVFSAAERESAYVIDGLMHNDVIRSDIHSTDEHGYNETIFGVTHLLGLSYAPRIKNIGKQQLYRFHSRRKDGANWAITPAKYVNEAAIRENWDDLLRLVATIKLKEAAASDIFRRLNSHSHQHRLYKAMKAFGQIIKSLFILRYLDDLKLRQAIEKQLNKVELANRFTRAVAVGNPREFAQVEKEEQEIAEACNRLIKNCIICWNYLYLARRLEQTATPEERDQLLRTIATHSPIAWGHINMLGEYDFSDEKLQDATGVLPPKNPPEIIPPDWEPPNREKLL